MFNDYFCATPAPAHMQIPQPSPRDDRAGLLHILSVPFFEQLRQF